MPTTPDPTSPIHVRTITARSIQQQIELLRECLNDAQAILAEILKEPDDQVRKKKSIKKKKGK